MQAIFDINRLTYATPLGRVLQEELTFRVRNGQMLLITGSNGCGKSTLLKAMLGQFPVQSGTVSCSVNEDDIEYIPQLENTELHFPLTLQDVLTISRPKSLELEEVMSYGLIKTDQLSTAWNTASGGERKRTLLTRALLKKPSMLVFDEPMNHLDHDSRRAMIRVMKRFLDDAANGSRAIVMVCHQGLSDDERNLFDVIELNLDRVVC